MTTSKISGPRSNRREETQKLTDWRWVRLGDCVAKIGSGFTPLGGHAVYQSSGAPLIRSQNVHMNRFEPNGLAFISDEQSAEMESSQVLAGDVLLNITGASIGRVCVAPTEYCPANVNQHVCIIRSDGTLDSELLSFYFASHEFQKFIMSSQAGATRQALTKAMIEKFRVPYAELSEQRRIAAQLREQMTAVEHARAAVQAQLDAAQTLPAALLRAVFESGKWKWLRIDELTETCSGTTPSRSRQDFYGGRIPWVKTGELVDGIIHDTEEHITETALRETSLRLLPKNTLLIAMYGQGQTRGRTALLACEATTNQACYAILPNEHFDPKFLQLWFQFSYARLRQASEGRGGNQSNFNGKVLGAEKVPLPTIPEQQAIITRLDAELTAVRTLVETLETRLAEIELLPPALLRRAFNGEN